MSVPAKDTARDVLRRRIFMKNVPSFATLKGLEIGALCSPLLTKDEADVKYYDIFPKETLAENFQKFYPGREFVDVDFVANTLPLAEVLGNMKFDYFIANHVVEHIPDFIGFFKAVHAHLNDGGKFFLAVPDRRLTADFGRSETTAGHLITDHEDSCSVDAAEHILDSLIYSAEKPNVYWSDVLNFRYSFTGHHHVFNYNNCIERIIKPLIRTGYFQFSLLDYRQESELGDEFVMVLEKCSGWDNINVLGEKITVQPQKPSTDINEFDFRVQLSEIAASGCFDPLWYLSAYPAVRFNGLNPLKHYFFWGAYHGCNPSERFDSDYYLEANPDVKQAKLNPLWHYIHNGIHEGRLPLPPNGTERTR